MADLGKKWAGKKLDIDFIITHHNSQCVFVRRVLE